MKKIFLIALLILGLALPTSADEFRGGGAACLKEELYDQIITAASRRDEQAWSYLLKNGCIIARAGIKVSILDVSWTGKVKVRAYSPSSDVAEIFWTNLSNIKRDDE